MQNNHTIDLVEFLDDIVQLTNRIEDRELRHEMLTGIIQTLISLEVREPNNETVDILSI